MIFHTLQFAVFFLVVYAIYLRLEQKWQNILLLCASYCFYGAWDYRFLILLFISTSVDYLCGAQIFKAKNLKSKRVFLALSITANLSILGFFKYFNFFVSNFHDLLNFLGVNLHLPYLNIILPLGISFYTFQSMSYSIDIYLKKLEPQGSFLDFALFVSFFPQLIAGPIERASHLLPQILTPRSITLKKFHEGCYLVFWGVFLKMFMADNLATIVDPLFAATGPYNGTEVLFAGYAFTFQIFGDFAGYSNIARGLGKCMGFDIVVNFHLPFFARNIQEYWSRWHISLSTWIRDYVFIPLFITFSGINLILRFVLASIIAMFLMGLWHGASWTMIIWGLFHGVLLSVYMLFKMKFKRLPWQHKQNRYWIKIPDIIKIIFMFHVTVLGMIIFRAQSLGQVGAMLGSLINRQGTFLSINAKIMFIKIIFFTGVVIILQIYQKIKNNTMAILNSNLLVRALFYYVCFYLLILYGVPEGKKYIYFIF